MIPVRSVVIAGSSTLEILPGVTSQFSVGENITAGFLGRGTLSIGSQASVTTGADFFAGFAPGSAGVVNMNGGFLSPFRTYIGFEGNATFTLENGSTLKSTRGYVGFLPGSQGLVNLSNSTTAENLGVPRDITIGVDGAGEIQSTSSQISALNFVMGSSVGSTGVVNLRGGTLTVEENLQVGNAGTGTLSVTNSAAVSSAAGHKKRRPRVSSGRRELKRLES